MRQAARNGDGLACNAMMRSRDVLKYCALSDAGAELLEAGVAAYQLSARAVHRTLRVARTIADLGGRDLIDAPQVAEALRLRSGLHRMPPGRGT